MAVDIIVQGMHMYKS